MSQAPLYLVNSEIMYKPRLLKGFRLSAEYQGMGRYFTDAMNSSRYKGFHVFNLRSGFSISSFECWVNCINVGNSTYATTVEKSAFGTAYRPGQLRTIQAGIAWHFGKHIKQNL
jgi:hypothetical protein